MFTHYLIKVAWGGNAHVAFNLTIAGLPNIVLRGCQNIEEVLLRKSLLSFFWAFGICAHKKLMKLTPKVTEEDPFWV